MIKTDVNGHQTSYNRTYCMKQIREKKVRVTEDSVNRVMVDLVDGGTIWFFKYNEPRLSQKLGIT